MPVRVNDVGAEARGAPRNLGNAALADLTLAGRVRYSPEVLGVLRRFWALLLTGLLTNPPQAARCISITAVLKSSTKGSFDESPGSAGAFLLKDVDTRTSRIPSRRSGQHSQGSVWHRCTFPAQRRSVGEAMAVRIRQASGRHRLAAGGDVGRLARGRRLAAEDLKADFQRAAG